MDLSAYVDDVVAARDIRTLNQLLIRTFEGLGARALSGFAFPFGGSPATDRTPIISTFPESVQTIYRASLLGNDPVMYATMSLGKPVHFLKLQDSLHLTKSAEALLDSMREAGFRDGVTTPVFAKPGAYGYFSAAFDRPRPDLTQAGLRRIQILFSEYFFRYRELRVRKTNTLSKREREVLVAIVNNKSNSEIAELLDVSEHTVETYVKRCLTKLDVANRTQAALQFLGGSA
ncbi:MAG: LuxR C-terminal-related transcriptional regulator [Hyphomonadaceae bacterium]